MVLVLLESVTVTLAGKVPVILTAGQSNADGRVPLAELPEELKTYKYCQWSYGSGDFETASGEFSPYSPRVAKPGIEQSWGFDAVVYKRRNNCKVTHLRGVGKSGTTVKYHGFINTLPQCLGTLGIEVQTVA